MIEASTNYSSNDNWWYQQAYMSRKMEGPQDTITIEQMYQAQVMNAQMAANQEHWNHQAAYWNHCGGYGDASWNDNMDQSQELWGGYHKAQTNQRSRRNRKNQKSQENQVRDAGGRCEEGKLHDIQKIPKPHQSAREWLDATEPEEGTGDEAVTNELCRVNLSEELEATMPPLPEDHEPPTKGSDLWSGLLLSLCGREAVKWAYYSLSPKRVGDAGKMEAALAWFCQDATVENVAAVYKVADGVALSAARHPRRALRDLWVWRACQKVGFGSRDNLMKIATWTFGKECVGNNLRAQLLLSYACLLRAQPREGAFVSVTQQYRLRRGKTRGRDPRKKSTREDNDYICDDDDECFFYLPSDLRDELAEPDKLKYPKWTASFQMGPVAGRTNMRKKDSIAYILPSERW